MTAKGDDFPETIGAAPADPVRYQRWRDAIERAAIDCDRYADATAGQRRAGPATGS